MIEDEKIAVESKLKIWIELIHIVYIYYFNFLLMSYSLEKLFVLK